MGTTSYSCDTRSMRAVAMDYSTKSVAQIFTQSSKRMAHESMLSKNVKIREARDSANHPNTVPICLFLDVTGSMGDIPHQFIKEGLPTLMGTLTQNGIPDAALLFAGIGDHEYDKYPVQVGQFESGDEELDMWLTRIYLEGGGGSNRGESYPLAWQFASDYTVTDSWEKRKKKGYVFTIGDERPLPKYPKTANKEIYSESAKQESPHEDVQSLLEKAEERYNVYHLHYCHGHSSEEQMTDWKQILGDRCIKVTDYKEIPKIMAKIIMDNEAKYNNSSRILNESNSTKDVIASSVDVPVKVKKPKKISL